MPPLRYILIQLLSPLTASAPSLFDSYNREVNRKKKVTGGAADSAYHHQLMAGDHFLWDLQKIKVTAKIFPVSLERWKKVRTHPHCQITNKTQNDSGTWWKIMQSRFSDAKYSENAIWPNLSVPLLCCLTAWGHVLRVISCRLAAPPNMFISLIWAGSCQVNVK